MRKYLLADLHGRTRRGMTIETNRANGKRYYSGDIVSRNIWECADTPLLAIMINPLHAECVRPRLFQISGKFGPDQHTVHRVGEIHLPEVSPAQKLAFAMYCVRSLNPEHAFGEWIERWLANKDRSIAGVKRVHHQLALSAKQGDKALAMLSDVGTRKSEINRLHDSEFEYLRRARDVVDAAATLIEKPRQWQVMISELVATATNNILGDSRRSGFAELAINVIPADSNKRQISEPKLLRRRRDDDEARKPNIRAYAVYRNGELKIIGRNPNSIKR